MAPSRTDRRVAVLLRSAADERSGRVVVVSHCLLNQNVRYAGGATCPGMVDELVESWRRDGVGVCQLPCPEQRAWGGVAKRRLLPVYGARGRWFFRFRRPLTWLFLARTRLTYRRLAGRVAREVDDYVRSGLAVTSVVGVAGSPSCGVETTVDVTRVVDGWSRCPLDRLDRPTLTRAVEQAEVSGPGLFMAAIDRALRRRGLTVPLVEHRLR